MNIAHWTEKLYDVFGTYDALCVDDKSWTNLEVHDASSRLSNGLIAEGLLPGQRVLIVLPTSFELFVAFIATLRAGAVAVLIDEESPVPECIRILQHCQAAAVITTSHRLKLIGEQSSQTFVSIATDADDSPSTITLQGLIRRSTPLREPVPRTPDEPAQIVYTSGTTGQPKAITYTHGNIAARYPFQGSSDMPVHVRNNLPVRLMVLPASHALGGSFLFLHLSSKCKVVGLNDFDPRTTLELIETHKVTTTILAPPMCEALIKTPDAEQFDLASLRAIVVGSAAVPASLIERFESKFKKRLSITYGLTEVPGATLGLASTKHGAVGRLAPGVEARIVDQDGQELPLGEVGAVLCAG